MRRFTIVLTIFLAAAALLILRQGATLTAQGPTDVPSTPSIPDESWRERAATKMDNDLLSQLRNQPNALPLTVIVRLGVQADLSQASQLRSRATRGAYVYRTLQAAAARSQVAIRAFLDAAQRTGGVQSYTSFFIFNGLAVTARPETIWQLALRDDVESVRGEQVYRLYAGGEAGTGEQLAFIGRQLSVGREEDILAVEPNISQIHAEAVWANFGVTGQGVLVANIDTGVQFDHPALVNQYAGRSGSGFDHNFHWFDSTQPTTIPYDDNGHGTHTMGTAVGGDGPGPFPNDIGVAPDARWIAVKAFFGDGTGTGASLHQAFEWLLAPCPLGAQPGDASCDPSKAPHVVNNSWGNDNGASGEFLQDVAALRAAGIFPVFSAGNNGPDEATIAAPASSETAFAVGAVDSRDGIALFSSRGPSPLTAVTKPDLVAPGVAIRSSFPENGYLTVEGTSMAAPHATGTAALLLSAEPALDLDSLAQILRVTAVDLGLTGPDTYFGNGRLDALAAMERLVNSGKLEGIVRDAATQTPLAGALVRAQGAGMEATAVTAADGTYHFPFLLAGSYTISATVYGYAATTVANIAIIAGQTTSQDVALTALPRYTVSGIVSDAVTSTLPLVGATVTALDTPLLPTTTNDSGFYSLEVVQGVVRLETAVFGYATQIQEIAITGDTTTNFALAPLPPILLVDDDEGRLRNYSPHVEAFYFNMLDANGFNYDYWDIELKGAPDFATIRQYPAVVWFGGEFGRIKDVSDAPQAQAVIDYLTIGGHFFYIAQSHTFYFGEDGVCDTPRWGGSGPCPFSANYLGIADWVEDQKADTAVGVAGNPVGDGLGPYTMTYPPLLADFTDTITGTAVADLAFVGLDDQPAGQVNLTGYTLISPTHAFRSVFLASPLEAFPAAGAADTMLAVMNWFGITGLTDGPGFAPKRQTGRAVPGETITYPLRLRNFSAFADSYTLTLSDSPWPATIWDAALTTPITQVGPVAAGGTVDLVVQVQVPLGVATGAEQSLMLRAESQSGQIFIGEAALLAQARMVYYLRDSDQCNGGVHDAWVDATVGQRWDIDTLSDSPEPVAVAVVLPQPFLFYNVSYDHIWVSAQGMVLFGDDNLYDDFGADGNPPIPNPTLLDPNGGIYAGWGNLVWYPSTEDPNAAVYTYHDTNNGRNRFVVEYYLNENFFGARDTYEIILDLDTYEITTYYQTSSESAGTTVGIENQVGSEGILYVNNQQPAANSLHDELVIRYGIGTPPPVWEMELTPTAVAGTGTPGGFVDYTLTLHSNSSHNDNFTLELVHSSWPVTFWDPTFEQPVSSVGPLAPCQAAEIGVRVQLPDTIDYVQDVATVRARSQGNTLLTAVATLTTDNADPSLVMPLEISGGGYSGEGVRHIITLQNSGNVTDTYDLSITGNWPMSVGPTQTLPIPPGQTLAVAVDVTIPPTIPAGESDLAQLTAVSSHYPGVSGTTAVSTAALPHVAVAWDEPYQEKTGPANWVVGYLLTVRNTGNLTDRFAVSALGANWETTLWNDSFTQPLAQTGPLGPNETQRIGVRVGIPAGVAPPAQDGALIRAQSLLDGSVVDYTLLVTAVTPPPPPPNEYSLVVAPAGSWQLGVAGQTLAYSLTLTNTGIVADSYTLTLSGHGWPTSAPATVPTLLSGASTTVVVQVTVAADGVAWDEAVVMFHSVGQTAVADQAHLFSVRGVGETAVVLYLPIIYQKP